MELLRIKGERRLEGSVAISGSKNAAMPVMAAALLTDQPVELLNVPNIEDIEAMARMLEHVGVIVERVDVHRWRLRTQSATSTEVGEELTGRLRASFLPPGRLLP